jgi:hypothetical protein
MQHLWWDLANQATYNLQSAPQQQKVERAPSKFTNGQKKPQNEPEEEEEKP